MIGTQIKYFCNVDVNGYIESIRKAFTKLDMNWDPEVDPKLDEKRREEQAKRWLDSRLNQLASAEAETKIDLEQIDFLPFNPELSTIRFKVRQVYTGLRTEAQNLYEKARKGEPIERPRFDNPIEDKKYQDPTDAPEHQIPEGRKGPLMKGDSTPNKGYEKFSINTDWPRSKKLDF